MTGGSRPALARMVPALVWLRRYRSEDLRRDAAAGVTVAAMLVPQAMAYALLAGLPPEVGLYAATVPLVAYALLGTSGQLAVGPVAIVSLMTAAALGSHAVEGTSEYLALAAALALLVGTVHLVMGAARLGFLVNLLSHSVLVGFTAAAALIIGVSQVEHVLGIEVARHERFDQTVREVIEGLGGTSWVTVAMGAAAMAALVALRRWRRSFPAALVVVVVSTAVSAALGLEARGLAVVGDIPAELPTPSLPDLDRGVLGDLTATAVAITFVGFMESIAVAKVYARRHRYEIDPNRELIGLGAANAAAGLFVGYPVTGGFSRTAVNAEAGAKTPLASLVTAAGVVVTLVAFTPLLRELPRATLGAVVIVAVGGLIDVDEVGHIARVKRSDLITSVTAFVATLVAGIEIGILIAVAVSLVVVLVRMSGPHSAVLGRVPGTSLYRNVERFSGAEAVPGVVILRIDASLSFANVAFLRRRLSELVAGSAVPVRAVVLDASGINDIDASAEAALWEAVDDHLDRGIELVFTNLKGPVRDVLRRGGLWDRLGPTRLHPTNHDAVTALTTDPTSSTDHHWPVPAGLDERP